MRRPTYSSASFRGKPTNKQKTAVCNSHSWHYDVVTSLDLDLLIHIKSFNWNSALFMYSFKSSFSKVCLNFTYHIETNELLIHCGLKIAVLQTRTSTLISIVAENMDLLLHRERSHTRKINWCRIDDVRSNYVYCVELNVKERMCNWLGHTVNRLWL